MLGVARISPNALDPPSKPRKAKSSKGVRVMNPLGSGREVTRRGLDAVLGRIHDHVTKNKHRRRF